MSFFEQTRKPIGFNVSVPPVAPPKGWRSPPRFYIILLAAPGSENAIDFGYWNDGCLVVHSNRLPANRVHVDHFLDAIEGDLKKISDWMLLHVSFFLSWD